VNERALHLYLVVDVKRDNAYWVSAYGRADVLEAMMNSNDVDDVALTAEDAVITPVQDHDLVTHLRIPASEWAKEGRGVVGAHWSPKLSHSTVTSKPEDLPPFCDGCGNEIDHDVCHCGDGPDSYEHHAALGGNHAFVADGCTCLFVDTDWAGLAKRLRERLRFERRERRLNGGLTKETQRSISTWAEETFGPAVSNASCAARANQEMAELLTALASDDHNKKTRIECADIVIVLYRLCERNGWDLLAAIDEKMAINRARKWQLTGDGHGQHIDEDEVTP
jgi:hypothetical protein